MSRQRAATALADSLTMAVRHAAERASVADVQAAIETFVDELVEAVKAEVRSDTVRVPPEFGGET